MKRFWARFYRNKRASSGSLENETLWTLLLQDCWCNSFMHLHGRESNWFNWQTIVVNVCDIISNREEKHKYELAIWIRNAHVKIIASWYYLYYDKSLLWDAKYTLLPGNIYMRAYKLSVNVNGQFGKYKIIIKRERTRCFTLFLHLHHANRDDVS